MMDEVLSIEPAICGLVCGVQNSIVIIDRADPPSRLSESIPAKAGLSSDLNRTKAFFKLLFLNWVRSDADSWIGCLRSSQPFPGPPPTQISLFMEPQAQLVP